MGMGTLYLYAQFLFWESVVIVLSTILHCVPNSDLRNLESLVQL